MTKNKWKVFAVGHFFSTEFTDEEALSLYDKLQNCHSNNEVYDLTDDLELWTVDPQGMDLPEALAALAEGAQEVEAKDET